MKPLAIDLFCGLGGWAEGLLAAGWDVAGFDIERHSYGPYRYPAQLVLQDVLTLHGSQFREADLIVASPPCQEYSYMAMPWKRAKAKAAAIQEDTSGQMMADLNRLFDACFRIAGQASLAAGRRIPLIVENVRGAQKWVGRARWHYGSFYLWGDVPALMPPTTKVAKVPGVNWHDFGKPGYQKPSFRDSAFKSKGMNWSDLSKRGQDFTRIAGNQAIKQHGSGEAWWDKALDERRKAAPSIKVGGGRDGWFGGNDHELRRHHSKHSKRKAAAALIAKIPFPLAHYIGRVFYPQRTAA